jgi:hypothetical protein
MTQYDIQTQHLGAAEWFIYQMGCKNLFSCSLTHAQFFLSGVQVHQMYQKAVFKSTALVV